MGDAALSGKAEGPADEFLAFLRVGVASLVRHLEYNRECHSIVDDAESEDVDVRVAELPIGPVHGQGIRSIYRYEFQNELGYKNSADDAFCNKSPDSAQ